MARTDYAYTVAYVRAIESKLMSSSELDSLIGQKTAEDSLRILSSASYPGIDKAEDFESYLSKSYNNSYKEIASLTPKGAPLWLYIIKNDFHNLKVCLKSIYLGSKSYDEYMLKPCVYDWDELAAYLYKNDFSSLPEALKFCAAEAFKILGENGDSRIADSIIDKAYMDYRVMCAKKEKLSFLEEFYLLSNTMTNIKIAARCAIRGSGGELMDNAISDMSSIDSNELKAASSLGIDKLAEYLVSKGYETEARLIGGSFADFEKYADTKEGEFMQRASYMTLGVEPLFAYLYAREREIQSLRIIINAKKNSLGEDIIRQRVRM